MSDQLVKLPDRYAGRRLESYDPTVSLAARHALEAARAFVAGDLDALVLMGRPGAGKTHLMAGIAMAIAERDWSGHREKLAAHEAAVLAGDRGSERPWDPPRPIWHNVPDLMTELRQSRRGVDRLVSELAEHRGLVLLDDIGREKVTEWTGEMMYRLVNGRYERRRRTVASTNLTTDELEANGYGAVLSRLADNGRIVEMASAVDYRTRRPRP